MKDKLNHYHFTNNMLNAWPNQTVKYGLVIQIHNFSLH